MLAREIGLPCRPYMLYPCVTLYSALLPNMLANPTKRARALLLIALVLCGWATQAQEPGLAAGQSLWWIAILLFVGAVTAASAALPLAALRVWAGPWRLAAMFPLLVLVFWALLILVSKWLDPSSRSLWAFEVFAWAMLNMIYMVAMMTAKRIIDKSDNEQSANR